MAGALTGQRPDVHGPDSMPTGGRAHGNEKDLLERGRDAPPVVQHSGRHQNEPAPRPGRQAHQPGPTGPRVPDEPDRTGGQHPALDRHPGGGAARLHDLAAEPARARPVARKGPRDTGAHLLQVRGRQPPGQPQAQHGHPAGVLQQGVRHPAAGHGNRRRPVGERAGLRLRPVRPRVQGLHGAHQLRPEALPQDHDADLGGRVRPQPQHARPRPAATSWRSTPTLPAASGSPSARRSRRPSATPPAGRATRSAACSTT